MKKKHQATESLTLEQAKSILPITENWSRAVLLRLSHNLPTGKLKILEIGSAQGRALISLSKFGHEIYGIEPSLSAIQIAEKLAKREKVNIKIKQGVAENIPFESNYFDLVVAFSVMEHVEDLGKSLEEIFRVIKPGGIFWFNSASSMCPFQDEIRGYLFFGWYPDWLKKKIMNWSLAKRPDLIGYTNHPAIHWWTPRKARSILKSAGFNEIVDRWDLRMENEDTGVTNFFMKQAKQHNFLRSVGDVLIKGCSYAARKPLEFLDD